MHFFLFTIIRKELFTPPQNLYIPRQVGHRNGPWTLTTFSKPMLINKLHGGRCAGQKCVTVGFSSHVMRHSLPLNSNSNDISEGKKKKIVSKQGCGFSQLWKLRAPERPQACAPALGKLCWCFKNNLAFHSPNLIPVPVLVPPVECKQMLKCNPKQTPVPHTYLQVSKHHSWELHFNSLGGG